MPKCLMTVYILGRRPGNKIYTTQVAPIDSSKTTQDHSHVELLTFPDYHTWDTTWNMEHHGHYCYSSWPTWRPFKVTSYMNYRSTILLACGRWPKTVLTLRLECTEINKEWKPLSSDQFHITFALLLCNVMDLSPKFGRWNFPQII